MNVVTDDFHSGLEHGNLRTERNFRASFDLSRVGGNREG